MGRGRAVGLASLAIWFWGTVDAAAPIAVHDATARTVEPARDAPACPAEQTGAPARTAGAGGTIVSFVLVAPGCEP